MSEVFEFSSVLSGINPWPYPATSPKEHFLILTIHNHSDHPNLIPSFFWKGLQTICMEFFTASLFRTVRFFFLKLFIFLLEYTWLIMWQFQVQGEGLTYTYTRIHSPPNSPPIQAATWHWVEFPVLSIGSLLVIHFKYSSVYVPISNSLSVPPFSVPTFYYNNC